MRWLSCLPCSMVELHEKNSRRQTKENETQHETLVKQENEKPKVQQLRLVSANVKLESNSTKENQNSSMKKRSERRTGCQDTFRIENPRALKTSRPCTDQNSLGIGGCYEWISAEYVMTDAEFSNTEIFDNDEEGEHDSYESNTI